jgi:hypothetical protein
LIPRTGSGRYRVGRVPKLMFGEKKMCSDTDSGWFIVFARTAQTRSCGRPLIPRTGSGRYRVGRVPKLMFGYKKKVLRHELGLVHRVRTDRANTLVWSAFDTACPRGGHPPYPVRPARTARPARPPRPPPRRFAPLLFAVAAPTHTLSLPTRAHTYTRTHVYTPSTHSRTHAINTHTTHTHTHSHTHTHTHMSHTRDLRHTRFAPHALHPHSHTHVTHAYTRVTRREGAQGDAAALVCISHDPQTNHHLCAEPMPTRAPHLAFPPLLLSHAPTALARSPEGVS